MIFLVSETTLNNFKFIIRPSAVEFWYGILLFEGSFIKKFASKNFCAFSVYASDIGMGKKRIGSDQVQQVMCWLLSLSQYF